MSIKHPQSSLQSNKEIWTVLASMLQMLFEKERVAQLVASFSRIDAVASRVQTAVTMRKVTQSMAGVVNGMDKAMKSMNLEQISMVMDKFESQFEDLDVQTEYMENAMGQTTALTTPQDQVEELMHQVADANGLELQMEMPGAGAGSLVGTVTVEKEHDALNERLAKLRNA
ncbi:hypothetical protein BSLG_004328 [Batrachochytrium salamandrivorans]|nr:hypothetical protein BSLG_004328 [Batrachochytrium salamandrivorans]